MMEQEHVSPQFTPAPTPVDAEPAPSNERTKIHPLWPKKWPWPFLYEKDRIGMSDRMYEVAKDGSFRVIFKFTKQLRKKLQRERNANAQGSTPVPTVVDPGVLSIPENVHSECD